MLREPEFKRAGGEQEPVRILLVEDDAISAEILRAQRAPAAQSFTALEAPTSR
jgi:hypothetical protein